MYKSAISNANSKGLKFTSDSSVSEEALNVYKSLEKEGYKFKYNLDGAKKSESISGSNTKPTTQYISRDNKPVVELISSPSKLDGNPSLKGVMIEEQVKIKETGEIVTVKSDAEVMLRRAKKRVTQMQKLRGCLGA